MLQVGAIPNDKLGSVMRALGATPSVSELEVSPLGCLSVPGCRQPTPFPRAGPRASNGQAQEGTALDRTVVDSAA